MSLIKDTPRVGQKVFTLLNKAKNGASSIWGITVLFQGYLVFQIDKMEAKTFDACLLLLIFFSMGTKYGK